MEGLGDAHRLSGAQVAEAFKCDIEEGLTEHQVLVARARYGRNELPEEAKIPFWKLVLKQFDDLLVKILIAAAVVDLIIAFANGETGITACVEPAVIFLILVANAIVGVVTETNAEGAIAALKAYEADVAHCVRGGRLSVIPAADLVPGDVVEVSVGGKVPADLRVLEVHTSTLRIDQSILTGESGSVEKVAAAIDAPANAVYQDKINLLFSGTVVTAGRAKCIVVGTGASTAIGQINNSLNEGAEEMTPLKQKLDEFGAFLSKVIAGICIAVWAINIPHFSDAMHGSWLQGAVYYFKIAVALAVAAIPEGLPAVVTTCLALGTRKMAKRNAIVRSLPSVETLGCTTVICSDKTGTLTTNMMSVVKVAVPGMTGLSELDVEGSSFAPEGRIIEAVTAAPLSNPSDSARLIHCALCASVCNDSALTFLPDKNTYSRVGESTEVALRVLAEKVGLPGYAAMPQALALLSSQERATFCSDYWREQYRRLATLEFDSSRKMMSVLCRHQDSSFIFSKGAPETLLPKCSYSIDEQGEASIAMTSARVSEVLDTVRRWSERSALRCLALAYKAADANQGSLSMDDEGNFVFLGVVGLQDPPRGEVLDSVHTCRMAGIRVIMITGDNKATAEAVARQVGVMGPEGTQVDFRDALDDCETLESLTAAEFDQLSPRKQALAARHLRVFSRVEPKHKRQLVQLLKDQSEVVAMTGDGVNDAPALRSANIGIAMGSGTAVAKYAADMVLADDNFATIVTAVEEGRAIFANTKQFIRYMVSSNIGEVVAIFVAALLGLPSTLTPVQLLWVNLVTDGLPATALSFNRPDRNLMRSQPRHLGDGIVNRWLFFRYTIIGLYVGVVTVAGFAWWFTVFEGGPRITWAQLQQSQKCVENANGYSCAIFRDPRPSTISMSILVVVEMFNALNALSENSSLLSHPPWRNLWLLAAIAISMALHVLILYVPPLSVLFTVTGLSYGEWRAIFWLSAPVVAVDEVLKAVTRQLDDKHSFRAQAHQVFGKYMPLRMESHKKDESV